MDSSQFRKLVDDQVIFGKDKKEVDASFEAILKVLEDNVIVASLKKLQEGLRVNWCGFLLRVVEDEGPIFIEPDQEKLDAIKDYTKPKNRKQLQSLLGLRTQIQN